MDENGNTALNSVIIAANKKDTPELRKVISILIKNDANPNYIDQQGRNTKKLSDEFKVSFFDRNFHKKTSLSEFLQNEIDDRSQSSNRKTTCDDLGKSSTQQSTLGNNPSAEVSKMSLKALRPSYIRGYSK